MEGYFKIVRIDGEYAYLLPEGGGEELFIAMALLPMGVDVGSRLYLRDMTFEVAD